MKKRKAKIKDRVQQLKEQLEIRIEAEDNKIEHAQNYSTKIVGMLGDIARQIIELQERVKRLERRKR